MKLIVDENKVDSMIARQSNFGPAFSVSAALATLLLLVTFSGCGPSVIQPPAGSENPDAPSKSEAEIADVVLEDLARQIDVPASVEGYEKADLKSRLEAYVGQVLVDIGDEVEKGQLLAELDVPEMSAEVERLEKMVAKAKADADTRRAELKQAEAKRTTQEALLKLRQSELETIRGLVQGGALTREQQDESQYALDSAAAELQSVDADIATAEALVEAGKAEIEVAQAELRKAQSMNSYLEIRAPFDGLITARHVDPGELVRPGSDDDAMLFSIENVGIVRVVMHLAMDADAAKLDVGDTAVLHGISRRPGETFAGEITRFAKSFDHSSRMMRAEMDLPNPVGESTRTPNLHSGDYGTVTVTLQTFEDIAVVPQTAIAEDDTGTYVIGVDGQNSCRRHAVVRQVTRGDLAGITGPNGEKLAATRVIVKDVPNYKDGDSVNPSGGNAAEP